MQNTWENDCAIFLFLKKHKIPYFFDRQVWNFDAIWYLNGVKIMGWLPSAADKNYIVDLGWFLVNLAARQHTKN